MNLKVGFLGLQILFPHHVIVEGVGVGVNHLDHVGAGARHNWDQLPHLGIELVPLTFSVSHLANHRTQS